MQREKAIKSPMDVLRLVHLYPVRPVGIQSHGHTTKERRRPILLMPAGGGLLAEHVMSSTDLPQPLEEHLGTNLSELNEFAAQLANTGKMQMERIDADPSNVEQGLAKLVLTIIELIRQLLEKQAIRRMDSGTLTDAQIERMGETFLKLEQKMEELKTVFGLEAEDLNLNLGPLGDLM